MANRCVEGKYFISEDCAVNLYKMHVKSDLTKSQMIELSVNFMFNMAGILSASTGKKMGDSVRAIAYAYKTMFPSDISEFEHDPKAIQNAVELLNILLEEVNPELLQKIETELIKNGKLLKEE